MSHPSWEKGGVRMKPLDYRTPNREPPKQRDLETPALVVTVLVCLLGALVIAGGCLWSLIDIIPS